MKAFNIKWDLDDKEHEEYSEFLPNEMEIPEYLKDEDEISDYISNETGFCHYGFELIE